MVWNHLKTAFRILRKQKLTAAINIIGLGIGLSFFILLVAYVRDDLTFDRFHEKADRTYILTSEFRDRFFGSAHHFIAEMLEAESPEVESGSTVRYAMHSQIVRSGNLLIVKDFAFTEPGFFDMFSFDLSAGDPSRLLSEPHQVVITSATAQAFFSGDDPMGKTLSIQVGDSYRDFTVSGIVREIPGNSSIRFDGILHFSHVFDAYQIDKNNNDFVTLPMFTTTLLDLPDERRVSSLRDKLPSFSDRLYGPMWERVKMAPPKQGFDLLKFADYHRSDVSVSAFASPGHPAFSWVLSGIALLILVLACVNSVNLSLAQSSTRLKEVGVRRVIGARKEQLVGQLMTESLLTGLVSLVVGLTVAALLIVPFNTLTGKRLVEKALLHPQTLLIVLSAVLAVCLFTGLIPALSLSRFQASDVFQGRFPSGRKSRLSLILIVFQFTVSLIFIIGTLVITRQLHFMTSADLGYDPSDLILVRTQVPGERAPEGKSLFELFRSELQNDSRVLSISADSGSVGTRHGSVTRRYDKEGLEHIVEAFMIDQDYMKTLDIPVILGRDFSVERLSDASEGVLVNEAFVKDFELKDPVGQQFSDFAVDKLPPEYTFDPTIIGVVRNFHVFSLHVPIGPMAFGPWGFPPIQRFNNILVKVREGEEPGVLKRLEAIWAEVRPDLPFSYSFLDDDLAWEYRRERDWGRIVGWSTGFALVIACMGLFGLTAVTVVRRTKETGIRMVLGASTTDIFFLFTKDVLKWVLISNLIAWPIALVAARNWLDQFAYRIDIGIWMFALSALLSFLVAGSTVSWHAVRASLSDPVQSLRYE
ncbi:MAG TPA: ABC transporter permease [Candidatus Heimdallarchaeota archaeon]|nr:ABC transporter permease [Candidatus Heimdallarchaeota archaeon]